MQKDKHIINKIQEGNLEEFENVFRLYYPLLCHYALQILKEDNLAEEIVQDLFCHLWENKQNLNIHTSLKAYLYKATYQNSLQYLRKKAIRKDYREYVQRNGNIQSTIPVSIEEHEIQTIIKKTLLSLPIRCSKIFKMSRFEGLKYHEIADKLSISVKTVEANMGKALKAFRKNLKDYVTSIVL
ncbi:RNA polymerase sigma-70 factor [Ancylomarina longa]|uniref:RNA polymerase sigma-70 factor n=1 Tax=Ancylomarina longa TaxID=2487017 RepID=A0A434AF78_9BACT|nr:RNA polymerase sigma-70 factor [Ancylomarina longa]RUT73033.1 RNA polymerase sigma-70 factor [Ancylomarina longa]